MSCVYRAKQTPLEIGAAVHRIHVLAGQRIPRDRVDREVAPARRLVERHEWVAAHFKALVPASLLGLAAREGNIDRDAVCTDDFVDRKALTDRLDPPERRKQSRQLLTRDPEDFHVDVFGSRLSALGSGVASGFWAYPARVQAIDRAPSRPRRARVRRHPGRRRRSLRRRLEV